MQASDIPVKIPIPWGKNAGGPYIRAVPTPSQIGITNGAASFTDGFPPLNFVAKAAGGVPPFGEDFNGILNQATAGLQFMQAGVVFMPRDPAFQTAIGGYPKGAVISGTLNGVYWLSIADNNLTNPESLTAAGWQQFVRAKNPFNTTATFTINSSTGNDNNPGTGTFPFQTLQGGLNSVGEFWDFSQSPVQFNCTGNFTAGLNALGASSLLGATNVIFNFVGGGNTVATVNAPCFSASGFTELSIQGTVTLSSSGSNNGYGLSATDYGKINVGSGVTFGAHVNADAAATFFGFINFTAAFTVSGNAPALYLIGPNGLITHTQATFAIVLSGNPVFSSGTLVASGSGANFALPTSVTYSGSTGAGGPRYVLDNLAYANVNGAGANAIPGTSAGTTAHNAVYN